MGGLVRSRGRLEPLANADATTDRDETATAAGTLVLGDGGSSATGELYAGVPAAALSPCAALVVASSRPLLTRGG